MDVVPGRSGPVYRQWLQERGTAFTAGVKIATLDPFQGYKNAISHQCDELQDAVAVVDAFHVVECGHLIWPHFGRLSARMLAPGGGDAATTGGAKAPARSRFSRSAVV